jgi:OmpA-like transmembrane domain
MKHLQGAALAALMISTAAQAENPFRGSFFKDPAVYGGLGASNTSYDDDHYYRDLFSDLGAGQPATDDNDSGAHVFAGYRFNKYFAAELGTRYLGTFKAKSATARYKQEFSALTISGVGFLPVGKYISLYGQAGLGGIGINEKLNINNFQAKNDDGAGTATLGAGIEFRPMGKDGLSLRLSWQSYFFSQSYDRYYVTNNGSNVQVYIYDQNNYDQRIDTYGLDLAYYFSL